MNKQCEKWVEANSVSERCKLKAGHHGPCLSFNNTGKESVVEIQNLANSKTLDIGQPIHIMSPEGKILVTITLDDRDQLCFNFYHTAPHVIHHEVCSEPRVYPVVIASY